MAHKHAKLCLYVTIHAASSMLRMQPEVNNPNSHAQISWPEALSIESMADTRELAVHLYMSMTILNKFIVGPIGYTNYYSSIGRHDRLRVTSTCICKSRSHNVLNPVPCH